MRGQRIRYAQPCKMEPSYPLIAKFGVAIVAGALDWERHCADSECPLDANLVDQWSAEKTHYGKHSVLKCSPT